MLISPVHERQIAACTARRPREPQGRVTRFVARIHA
jgi:hypothetical protein